MSRPVVLMIPNRRFAMPPSEKIELTVFGGMEDLHVIAAVSPYSSLPCVGRSNR